MDKRGSKDLSRLDHSFSTPNRSFDFESSFIDQNHRFEPLHEFCFDSIYLMIMDFLENFVWEN